VTVGLKTLQSQQKDKPVLKESKWVNYSLTFLFFSGLVLTVFEINIFRKTIIDWKIPTGIWLGVGLISLRWLRTYLAENYNTKNVFLQLVFCVGSFGGIFAYGFMATNYYLLNNNEPKIIKTSITKTGHLAKGRNGCGNPYAYVKIKGVEKELIFPCNLEIEKYEFVLVTLQRGLLGFDRILDQIPESE